MVPANLFASSITNCHLILSFSDLFFRMVSNISFMPLSFCVLTCFSFFMVFSLANVLLIQNVILTKQ